MMMTRTRRARAASGAQGVLSYDAPVVARVLPVNVPPAGQAPVTIVGQARRRARGG